MSNKTIRKRRAIWLSIFIVYITLLIYFLFFSDTFGRQVAYEDYRYNLTPFAEIKRFYTRVRDTNYSMFFINIIGNVVLFIPFGFLFSFIYSKGGTKKCKTFIVTIFVSLVFCLAIETLQLVTRVGVFDVDDIMMNMTGTVIGYLIFLLLYCIVRKQKSETGRKRYAEAQKRK